MKKFGGGDLAVWPKVILFDLDGTLIDSAPDIRASTNILLAKGGHAELSLDEVRSMIGNGVKKLVQRAFAARDVALDDAELNATTDSMMKIYGDHLVVHTVLMPHADRLIRSYHAMGTKLGIVTNKPEGFSSQIVDHFALSDMIDIKVGGDTGPDRKPAPDMLFYALKQLGLDVSQALFVGDSPADIDAARAAGMTNIAVRGGYTNVPVEELGADMVIDSLNALPSAIESLMELA